MSTAAATLGTSTYPTDRKPAGIHDVFLIAFESQNRKRFPKIKAGDGDEQEG